jgi:hypothetical protein
VASIMGREARDTGGQTQIGFSSLNAEPHPFPIWEMNLMAK